MTIFKFIYDLQQFFKVKVHFPICTDTITQTDSDCAKVQVTFQV